MSIVPATALLASSATAFAPAQSGASRTTFTRVNVLPGAEVDGFGNNVAVKKLLTSVEKAGLLTKVAESGLLSSASAAGVSLAKLEPLLLLAAENPDILIITEAAGPELLPLLPKLIDLAPPALPLLALAIKIPPALLQIAAVGSLGAAAGIVLVVPDDTVLQVAAQTLAVGVLGVAVPAASAIGSIVIGKVTK